MQTKLKTLNHTAQSPIRRGLVMLFAGLCLAVSARSATLTNLFFLHHSTGNGLITEGDMRGVIAGYNTAHAASFAFWDHGYNDEGLRDPAGNMLGISYEIPNDNTNPDGLYYLWTSQENDAVACRGTILAGHQVIAFKSCFPASDIPDADTLNQYKAWYLEMRDVFDQRRDHLFVVMSTPPLHRLATSAAVAYNARQFANWLESREYVGGHTNVVCFNLFDYLAGSDNMLKSDYEGSHTDSDSHPNELANQTVGPIFANFLISSALSYNASGGGTNLAAPLIMANGATSELVVSYPDTVSVAVEMNAGESAGMEADWWAVAFAQNSGEWYYLNSGMEWTMFNGDLALCRPAHQGPLFNLASTTVLNGYTLPRGTFYFYFAVDRKDGILNYPAGPIKYDRVTIFVE